jgi:hypothetical protein
MNGMLSLINTKKKTKEVLFHFGRTISKRDVLILHIHDVGIQRVQAFKLLGVYISCDLSWTIHVAFLSKQVS